MLDELGERERRLLDEQDTIARKIAPLLARQNEIKLTLDAIERVKQELSGQNPRAQNGQSLAGPTSEIGEAVQSLLQERGRPLHIRDILGALKERRVHIPGKG